jgi:hypothetical protein
MITSLSSLPGVYLLAAHYPRAILRITKILCNRICRLDISGTKHDRLLLHFNLLLQSGVHQSHGHIGLRLFYQSIFILSRHS